eukprot:Gb_40454 [translate_table: standard]
MASFSNTHRDDNWRIEIALSTKKAIRSPLEEIRVSMGKMVQALRSLHAASERRQTYESSVEEEGHRRPRDRRREVLKRQCEEKRKSKQVKQAILSAMSKINLDYIGTSFERETALQATRHIYESKDGHCHFVSVINDNACSNLLEDMDDKSFLHLDSHVEESTPIDFTLVYSSSTTKSLGGKLIEEACIRCSREPLERLKIHRDRQKQRVYSRTSALQKYFGRPSDTPIIFGRMPYEGNSCDLSCHLECALQHKKARVVKIGQLVQLDVHLIGRVSGFIGCWRKQLNIAMPNTFKLHCCVSSDGKTWIYYTYPKSTESSKSKVRPSSMEPTNGKRLERAGIDGETIRLSNDSGNVDDSNNGNLKTKSKEKRNDISDGTRVDGRNLNDNDPSNPEKISKAYVETKFSFRLNLLGKLDCTFPASIEEGQRSISTFYQHTTEPEVKSAFSTKETKLGDAKHHWDENITNENNMGRARNTTTFITPIVLGQSNSRRGHCYDS